MTRRKTALAVAAVVAAAVAYAPVAQAAPSPSGILCGFSSFSDPQVEGSQTSEVDAGPIIWTDDTDPAVVGTGSITCTIQVNGPTHANADSCAVTGATTPAVGFAAGTCTYAMWTGDNAYLCTEVTVDGTTLYYNSSNDPLVDGSWTTDPNAGCSLATSASPGGGGRPVYYPSGTMTVRRDLLGQYTYSYTGFAPPLSQWSCPTPSGPSMTCTPPPAPHPARNRCGTLAVDVRNNAVGLVRGESRCTTGPTAVAASTGPNQPGTGVAVSEGSFAWTCAATQDLVSTFEITCTVGDGLGVA